MPKTSPAPKTTDSSESQAPAKSVRALYREQLETFDKRSAEIDAIRADQERWRAEKKSVIESGAIRDERKIALVSTLDTKDSMVPHAIRREEEGQRRAIAVINGLYSPLTIEADLLLNAVRDELLETLRANAAIFCEESARIDEVVSYSFARTEYGRRYNELETGRWRGPFADRGSAGAFLDWFDRCVALHADWKACALRAGTVPDSKPDSAA